MITFLIWLFIVIIIILKSVHTNKQQKAKNSKSYTSVSKTYSETPKPKEDVFTKAKRNVSEDFSEDSLSIPTEFSQRTLQNTKIPEDTVSQSSDTVSFQNNSEDLMRTLDDLIVNGYEPHLTFERDFVAEGFELLNRYYEKNY